MTTKRTPTKSAPVRILSLGAGVQSSTLALMASIGATERRIDLAIFADTQAEPDNVYRWLAWLTMEIQKGKYPFPVHTVTKGSLTDKALQLRTRKDGTGTWTKSLIPVYTLEADGTKGHMQRACTYDYKLMELRKAQRRFGGIKRGQKTVGVTALIGISTDEASRMKPSRDPWVEHEWPLIDMEMSRSDCLTWMRDHGYPAPPKSSCVYCPYHDDAHWLRMQKEEPEEFWKAVKFERELQKTKAQTDNMRGVPFLHASRVPLDAVVFKPGVGKLAINAECEGMCGV